MIQGFVERWQMERPAAITAKIKKLLAEK